MLYMRITTSLLIFSQQWSFLNLSLKYYWLNNVWFRFPEKNQSVFPATITVLASDRHCRTVVRTWGQEMECLLSTVFSSYRAFWSLFSACTIAQQFDTSVYTFRYVFLKPSKSLCFDWLKISLLCWYFNIEHLADFFFFKDLVQPPSYSKF